MRRPRLTPNERFTIAKELAKGVSVQLLAERYGVSKRTVHYARAHDRKRKVDTLTKTEVVNARISERELREFDHALSRNGVTSRAEGLRRLISMASGLFVPDEHASAELRQLGAALGRIGSNINQIASRLNEARAKRIPPPYTARSDAEIRALAVLIFDLSDQIEDMAKRQRAGLDLQISPALKALAHGTD